MPHSSRCLISLAAVFALVGFASAQPRKIAVLIGVETYDHAFSKAAFAERDVTELAKVLRSEFEVYTLIGSKATKRGIEAKFEELFNGSKRMKSGDLVLISFHGHGLQIETKEKDLVTGKAKEDAFFCPVDAVANRAETMVSLSHLIDETLAPLGSTNLILVDACRNDPKAGRGRGIEGKQVKLPAKTAILFGCARGEQSIGHAAAGGGHGIFTYAVLKGLRGEAARSGKVTWSDLVSHVQTAMSEDAEIVRLLDGDKQTPIQAVGELPRTVLLASASGSEPGPKPVIGTVKPGAKDHEVDVGVGVKLKMVRVPKGRFWVGGGGGKEGPRQVDVGEFYIGVYEVTQAQWTARMGNNPSHFQGQDLPVEKVSWNDAKKFIDELNKIKKGSGYTYRLPTAVEWEYACRGAPTTIDECRFHFYLDKPTNNLSADDANFMWDFTGNGPKPNRCTVKVGSYKPNRLGLYDMHGNVEEWCEDLYPKGVGNRVNRGGGFLGSSGTCTASDNGRAFSPPDRRIEALGFRLAATPSQ